MIKVESWKLEESFRVSWMDWEECESLYLVSECEVLNFIEFKPPSIVGKNILYTSKEKKSAI